MSWKDASFACNIDSLTFVYQIFVKGLALASLLTVQNNLIYDRFTSIMTSLCEVLNDIMIPRIHEDEMYE